MKLLYSNIRMNGGRLFNLERAIGDVQGGSTSLKTSWLHFGEDLNDSSHSFQLCLLEEMSASTSAGLPRSAEPE